MTAADPDVPSKEADPKTDSPTKTSYQMSVKTDEKSAAVSDSQAGDASTHEATTEVKAAAQVEAAASDGSSPGDVGKLDVHLTYLWEVHRVNFYVGGDLRHTTLCMPPFSSLFPSQISRILAVYFNPHIMVVCSCFIANVPMSSVTSCTNVDGDGNVCCFPCTSCCGGRVP